MSKKIRGNHTRANAVRLRCISISVHCSVVTDARLMARLPSRSGGSNPAFAHWASAWHLRSSAAKAGGADRDRTDDLKLAKLALSQLSYGPGKRQTVGVSNGSPRRSWEPAFALSGFGAAVSAAAQHSLVGPGRVERPTSRLSGVRSNHLSYEPDYSGHFAKTIAYPGVNPRPCVGLAFRD